MRRRRDGRGIPQHDQPHGGGDVFDRAILEFSTAYAEQNERDYKALAAAAKSGRIAVEIGV